MPAQPRLLSANIINTLLSGGVGLLVGILIGVSIGGDREAQPQAKPPRPEAPNPIKPAGKVVERPRLPDFDLDIGTKAAKAVLTGDWKTQPREAGRSFALVPDKNAQVRFTVAPKAAPYGLSVVGKASGATKLDVVVSLNKSPLSTWSFDDHWSLQWAPIPPDALASGSTVLRFEPRRSKAETDAGAGGEAAAAFDHLRVEPLLPVGKLDLRNAADRARLLDGFHAVSGLKGTGKKGARAGVWSRGKRSTVGVLLAPAEGSYQLELRGNAYPHVAPLAVKVRVNGEPAGTLKLGDLNDYTLGIDRDKLKRGANIIEFRYPRTARPADVESGAKDTRELAMLLYELSVAPKPPE